ncbi:MAG TPA: response regulator, partial [Polyangiaceae bacterium]|nr:response regulator [Polyangiaceae bacterium]
VGHGSEFEVRLPALRAGTRAAARRPEPAPLRAAVASKRVLIVDDNVDAAELLAASLDALGHVTRVAYDGPSALQAAVDFVPEVALLDIGLPVMDGYELARQLRQMDTASPTWLVAITGYGQAADRRSAHEAGFDEHLVKPVNVDALLGILRRLDAAAGES